MVKGAWCSWLFGLWLLGVVPGEGASKCDGPPEGVLVPRSRLPDQRFRLSISANPSLYVPGEVYTIILQGAKLGVVTAKFVGFSLTVEPSTPGGSSGAFQLYGDSTIQFSSSCPNTVTHTTPSSKSEVQVLWAAPPPGSGCVNFKATVIEHRDLWYQEDGSLSKTLCEDTQTTFEEQPAVNQQCCACDEAKYEVTFEGLWSRHTHPKDFPSNSSWVPRFSDVIGASHTTDYRFWDYGGIASEGLKQVAEKGSTRMLESELKSQSQHIRTIIKARGISFPNVTGKTFAVFRVDNKHHLISLVSMIDPSPDWIVGVSGLELCLSNCSWLESKVIPLYPWDAGTDSGITYTSPDIPTEPRDNIRRITSSFPNDPRSPFYDPTGIEMKPLAMLYLTRQRLYEKSCSELNMEYNTNEACEVGEWSEWGPCSVTCGAGKSSRQRFYKNEQRAETNNCNRELTSRKSCHVPCRGYQKEDILKKEDGPCKMTEWSKWSGCSVSCGKGDKHRFRTLVHRRNWKLCMASQNSPPMREDSVCFGAGGPVCPQPEPAALTSACKVTEWSEWSPCSVSCGVGVHQRIRTIIGNNEDQCQGLHLTEEIPCELASCRITPEQARHICRLPKQLGRCRGEFESWHFDPNSLSCRKFMYTGCMGNRNRFDNRQDCEEACKSFKEEMTTPNILFGGIVPESQINTLFPDSYTVSEAHGPVVDCRVSSWSSWSECSVTCGRGIMQRTRHIIAHAKNGGKSCPRKLLKKRKCNTGPCEESQNTNYDDDDESTYQDECVYTEWSVWSLCSTTCGQNSVQQRTRAVDHVKTPPGAICIERLQTRVCSVPPCRVYVE